MVSKTKKKTVTKKKSAPVSKKKSAPVSKKTTVANPRKTSVAIIGGGIAGLSAALRLSQRNYEVTIFEAEEVLGGCLSSAKAISEIETRDGKTITAEVYHDVFPHMFAPWYNNFWDILDELGIDREKQFKSCSGYGMLEPKSGKLLGFKAPSSIKSILKDYTSGYQSIFEMYIDAYSLVDLATDPMDRGDLLQKHTVNGFLISRGYTTEKTAQQLDLRIMNIWSLHSYEVSASAYRDLIRVELDLKDDSRPFAFLLKGSLQTQIMEPFESKLQSLHCNILKSTKVVDVQLPIKRASQEEVDAFGITEQGQNPITISYCPNDSKKVDKKNREVASNTFDKVIFAVPPKALGRLLESTAPTTQDMKLAASLVTYETDLARIRRLRSEPIPVMYIYFKKKLKLSGKHHVPHEPIALLGSRQNLTITNLSHVWDDDELWGKGTHPPKDEMGTVLELAASDFYSLPTDNPFEDAFILLNTLKEYLGNFNEGIQINIGDSWGDKGASNNPTDIHWNRTRFLPNYNHKLFINSVGSSGWAPETHYPTLPNIFFAGDFVKNEVSMATVEGATLTGLQAAKALVEEDILNNGNKEIPPVKILPLEKADLTQLLLVKLLGAPAVYFAKAYVLAEEQLQQPQDKFVEKLPQTVEGILRLPFDFATDYVETAFRLGNRLLDLTQQKESVSKTGSES